MQRSSESGTGSTTAASDASWYVQVFSPAPSHQQFTITVRSPQGNASIPFVVVTT